MNICKIQSATRRFARDRRGNISILFAFASTVILLVAAIGLDFSRAATTRARMQAALDAAVLAGVKASETGTQAAAITVASDYFSGDATSTSAGATATFSFKANGSLTGTATYNLPTLYGGITGASTLDIVVTSIAAPGVTTTNVCILLLSPSNSQTLLANSGANINAPNCEIDVKSTANPDSTFDAGETINAQKICLQGSGYLNDGGTHPNVQTGCSTANNPYVGALPAPASTNCSGPYANGGSYSTATTLSPGVYCGWFNFNNSPTITLNPGVYVIKGGGWTVSGGKWTGSGVTFYFADTSVIQFNSGMNMTLTAPTSGTYSGILMYEPDGLAQSNLVFDNSVSETLSGLIYLPSRNITWNSTSNGTTPQMSLIANTATFDTLNWNLTPQSTWPVTNSIPGGSAKLTQ